MNHKKTSTRKVQAGVRVRDLKSNKEVKGGHLIDKSSPVLAPVSHK